MIEEGFEKVRRVWRQTNSDSQAAHLEDFFNPHLFRENKET
jgi:hypothetical protein